MTAPQFPSVPVRVAGPATLGRVALWLGIATLVLGLVSGVSWIVVAGDTVLGLIPTIAVLLGVATIVIGIVAIATRRGRTQAIVGLVLAVVAGPLAWLVALGVIVIMFAGWSGS